MTIIAELPHNLTVVFGHFEEVGNFHAALVTLFTAANRHDAIGHFLLAYDEEVRHLLQFALADLVTKLLTPLVSAAAPRSCQNGEAQAFCRDTRLARFLSRGRRSQPLRMLVLWVFPHILCGRAILQGHPCAPAARLRGSCNQASLRESCPQGVTLRKLAIPNANERAYARSNSHKRSSTCYF